MSRTYEGPEDALYQLLVACEDKQPTAAKEASQAVLDWITAHPDKLLNPWVAVCKFRNREHDC
jgi:hypothetical protein